MRSLLENKLKQIVPTELPWDFIDYATVEKKLNEHLKAAHSAYIKAVKDSNADYESYFNIITEFTKPQKKEDYAHGNINSIAAGETVIYVLENNQSYVEYYFLHNQYCDSYKDLVKAAISDGKKQPADVSYSASGSSSRSLLQTPLSDREVRALTMFANKLELFQCKLRPKDMRDFLEGKPGVQLQANKNSKCAWLLYRMAYRSFFKHRWASIIAANGSLVKSSGQIVDNAHALTASGSRTAKISGSTRDKGLKAIMDFVDDLYQKHQS